MAQTAPNSRQIQSSVHPAPVRTGSLKPSVLLRYSENSPILVRGPATGQQYVFSGAQPFQAVDARDAEALLRFRFFRRA